MRASSPSGPRAAAYLLAAAIAIAIAHSVYQIPIQVGDSLDVIVESATAPSTLELFAKQGAAGTLRPMRYLQARALVGGATASGASLHAWFRGTHAVLAITLVLLFAAAAPVRSWLDLAPFGLALTVLAGMHTFTPMLREAYPVNHFLEVAIVVLVVMTLAQRAPRAWAEAFVVLLLALALLLIETAVLIWVAIVACALLRLPGIRPRTAIVATLVIAAYAGARLYFEVGAPQIGAHGSGYGAAFYSGDELRARFGEHPLPFFGYNIAAGILSVLFSEPQNGVYSMLRAIDAREVAPVLPIQIVSSALLTLVIVSFVIGAMRRRRAWNHDDRLVMAAAIVLLASGALCLTYVKDEILSVAGVLYALTAFVATRWLLQQIGRDGRRTLALVAPVLFLVCAPLWAFRALGVHFDLRHSGFVIRNDWAFVRTRVDDAAADNATALWTKRLQQEALQRHVTGDSFLPPRGDRYWIE